MGEIITIKRKYQPGHVNRKGKAYTINSYINAIEKINEKIKNNELGAEIVVGLSYNEYVDMLSDVDHGMKIVDKENICANIISIHNKYIEIELNEDKNIKKLFEFYDQFNIKPIACMRYLAEKSIFAKEKDVNILDIITFDIVFPKIDKENASVKFNNTIKALHKKYKGVCKYIDIYKEELN